MNFKDVFPSCKYHNQLIDFPEDVTVLPWGLPKGFDISEFINKAKLPACQHPNKKSEYCNSGGCPMLQESIKNEAAQ